MKNLNLAGNPLRNIFSPVLVFALTATCLINSFNSSAQGDLMIYPKRIMFEGGKRAQDINLANSGKDTARYMITVIEIRMKEDGSFEQIAQPDSGQNFADKYFRIFPRNVVLAPNEAQTVKVQLINNTDLQPGEYRSHLYIRAEAERKPLGEVEVPADPSAISVKLVAVFGISIPVIIRSGDNASGITLSDVSLSHPNDTTPTLHFTFNRTGNMSSYGDISVEYISPEGKTIKVGSAKGIAVYTPTTRRNYVLGLTPPSGVDFNKGSLRVTYIYDGKDKEVEQKIALL